MREGFEFGAFALFVDAGVTWGIIMMKDKGLPLIGRIIK